jgi:hypothetical protein
VLLLAALLLGIVTMHTLGHPSPSAAEGHGGSARMTAGAGHETAAGQSGTGPEQGHAADARTRAGHNAGGTQVSSGPVHDHNTGNVASAQAGHVAAAAQSDSDRAHLHGGGVDDMGGTGHGGHGDGMDPASVCLAVLGVWSAAALLGVFVFVVVRRRRVVDFLAPVRARTLLALRPLPPPPIAERLAALSVLRT